MIRIYDCEKGDVVKQLTGGHTKNVVALCGYVRKEV